MFKVSEEDCAEAPTSLRVGVEEERWRAISGELNSSVTDRGGQEVRPPVEIREEVGVGRDVVVTRVGVSVDRLQAMSMTFAQNCRGCELEAAGEDLCIVRME